MNLRELMDTLRGPAARTRPVVLAPAGHRTARFAGRRGGEGPLTTGQRNTLFWVRDETAVARMVDWGLDLPPGVTLDDITAAFAVLLARHESLRTSYPDRPGGPVQHVAQSGELTIDLYTVAEHDPSKAKAAPSPNSSGEAGPSQAEPGHQAPSSASPSEAELALALIGRLRATEFDLSRDLPMRVAVAVRGDIPLAAAAVYSHMAADMVGMALVGQQFTALAADHASREPGEPGHQPLDQAALERSPRGLRIARGALRTWEARLRAAPPCMYATARPDPAAATGPAAAWLWSRAAGLALPHIAARTEASKQSAVLAALSAVLSHRTGLPDCTFTVLMHNRFELRLREHVGSLAGDTLISIDTRAASFDELVKRAAMTTLRAGKGGAIDGDELRRLIPEVAVERGFFYTRDCTYNDTSYIDMVPAQEPGDPAAVRDALAASELRWVPAADIGPLLAVFLWQVEGEMLLGAMTADTARVPRADLESLLHGVELLLAEAVSADVKLDRIGEITGVTPVPRGPGWILTDSCWVELAEVQRLVQDALPGVPALVTAEPAGSAGPAGPAGSAGSARAGGAAAEDRQPGNLVLTAYLAPSGPLTPEQAHAACMAVLPPGLEPPPRMRYTAIAPARYVICATAPPGPAGLAVGPAGPTGPAADPAAWRRQPVLSAGPGRLPSSHRETDKGT